MFDPREKIALFIDGANLYATSRALGFDIDYRKLLASFQKRGYLLRAYYYTALVEDQEYSSIRPLIDWLDYNGFKVVTKPAKEFTDSTGRRKIKGNMDIELTVDALELADIVDHYVIFSGDGDFRTLVEALQRRGRKVSVVSTMASQPPMISDDLRRQADHFIDLMSLKGEARPRPVGSAGAPARACRRPRRRSLKSAAMRLQPEPSRDCPLCPRLRDFRELWRQREPAWFNAPVPTFLPPEGEDSVRLLIVGLAPGLRGANRTGRPFTGDYAGDLLYRTLIAFGFARGHYEARPDDGLELAGTAITNAVRCVPPENKPLPVGDRHLPATSSFQRSPVSASLRAVLSLGAIAHQSTVRALGGRAAMHAVPARRAAPRAAASTLFSSYHCSRYNTNTGVLTEAMFVGVFREIRAFLGQE